MSAPAATTRDAFYTLEAETAAVGRGCYAGGARTVARSEAHRRAAVQLAPLLRKKMDDKSAELEALHRAPGWKRRRAGWTAAPSRSCRPGSAMLETLENGELRDEFVDWFEIAREDGRDVDVGLERHWVDPTIPLAARSAGAGAWRADHFGHACAISATGECRRLAERRSAHRRRPSAPAAAARQFRLAVPL